MNQRRMILTIVWTLFLDAGLAVGAYLIARGFGTSMFAALLIGTVVAGLRAAYVIIRRREVDAFAIFMIITFGIGLLLSLVTGSARFLLAKDAISSAISGLIFLLTLAVGKPMMFHLAQRFGATDEGERSRWSGLWQSHRGFRSLFRFLTVIWAVGFLVEAAVKLILVALLPVDTMAPILPFFTPVLLTGLVIWTVRTSALAQQRLRQSATVSTAG
ncbi:VC0807 family protein [Microlunatus soli]|uniref:Intracellular septation protein A n=1 Tax=Microlunatus soli TaxID=630515 RepID=A0A1H1PNS8_9ACTN|nr:VC0807 family protein [Microlunatus soli]SDS12942.1 hypothetical protein SAMN04489812_0971 [Microlunatus soli]